jgi:processive 1,2-diacylglycerol beta-glucosyltransferase
MLQPELLILSGSVGMGHVKAAEGVLQAAKELLPEQRSAHLDVVKLMPKPIRKLYSDGYLTLSDHAPTLLGMAYRMTDSISINSQVSVTIDRWLARRLERLLCELNPPVIVCTHFLASRVAGHLKRTGQISSKLVQVVTDFDLHHYWFVPETDHYFVAGRPAAERLYSLGVPDSQVTVSGIPIGAPFRELPSKNEARAELGLKTDQATILVTLGGAGRAPLREVLEGLLRLKNPATVAFVCGKNVAGKDELAQLLASNPPPPHLSIHLEGFTTKMHLYMAASDIIVGKPGGLTMSESLAAGLVPVLIQPIPGQEEHNADYLLEEGVGIRCRHLAQLDQTVDRLLANPSELANRASRSKQLGRPGAAREILTALQRNVTTGGPTE